MPNFFQLYDQYAEGKEPPHNFHAWCAIGAISALLGKKCQIPQGHFTVFPNLYIVLVGTPGTRKSAAMNIAKRLVRTVKEIPIAAESSSREALIDFMSTSKVHCIANGADISYWQASSFGTELEQFLGGKHINTSMVGFLTAIWDEPLFKESTRKGGFVVINNPYFTLLSCCTPGWIDDKLRNDVITDGFSRRVIFALEHERANLNYWPEDGPEKMQCLALMANECKRIFAIQGRFNLTREAHEFYKNEYRRIQVESEKYNEKVQSYFTSKHELALKISMCLSAGIDSSRIVTKDIIKAAFTFLAQSERCLETVFSGVGRNELKALSEKALNRIRKYGKRGATKAEFLRDNYEDLKKVEVDEIWDMLLSTGALVPVNPSSAQEIPRCRAAVLDPLPPGVNLLRLASQLTRNPKEIVGEIGPFDIRGHLDLETRQLLDSLAERKRLTDSGILLKGKRTQDSGGQAQS